MDSNPSLDGKPPRPVFDTPDNSIFAFPPNRDTLGATAYLVKAQPEAPSDNLLIDCPPWDAVTRTFLHEQGGIRWLFITHRGGIGKVRPIQEEFGCEVVIQEQEAYLLPEVKVTAFQQTFEFNRMCHAFWTSGHSPGSSCLYYSSFGGVLFSGRHLLPDQKGDPVPLRFAKTFHWRRQIQSIQRSLQEFSPETLSYICPGANTGFLRGQRAIDRAYQRLTQLDLEQCLQTEAVL
ncbi:MBL fold metallo-hydrolase [Oscillatoria sp. FACHB-1407]|uniref:MBL fold metallo-hydrolase n=1 Tax=Oscillatoria sp. FACHB-1407 TaxID=2692847 RepID=UPI001687080A|nr:MBL fold metallo-hydrolase [Oscillatoria sp. FACHB-1407]MBD2460799.1 MBL fold metallo-hydrolase [Oscillatoria sp. FACHB-1407]